MSHVVSSDGTSIAFSRAGDGPPLILVDGALCHRAFGPMAAMAEQFAPHYTVYTYDRRGRGESGDTQPYSVQREIEDIEALIKEAGGSAYLYGVSSGGALALEAANAGIGVQKLGVYEAPFVVDDTHEPRPDDYLDRMDALVAEDRRGAAVKLFMRTVGVPAVFLALMQLMPVWRRLKGVAHTLPYEFRILGDTGKGKPLPANRWTAVTMPTLVMDGGKSQPYLRNAMRMLADVLPNAEYRTLPGQTHMVKAKAQLPALTAFFGS